MQPHRRCWYMNERGEQCETWFPAIDDNKLCPVHREAVSPAAPRNGFSQSQKIAYIDLVNDHREYCYHFKDGAAQSQPQTLIYEFKDDQSGTAIEKLNNHIAFLDKVLEDVRSRMAQTRAVRSDKFDQLTEDQRKELRKIKVEPLAKPTASAIKVEKTKTAWSEKLKAIGANLDDDPEALLAKFEALKAEKERLKHETQA